MKKNPLFKKILMFLMLFILLFGSLAGYKLIKEIEKKEFTANATTFSQIEKSNPKARKFKFDDSNVDNTATMNDMIKLQKKAISMQMKENIAGHLKIESINQTIPIFIGANQYTLSLGAATYFYEDAEMGKGNFVLAGHNMEIPGVIFSDLFSVKVGDSMDLISNDTIYRYKADRIFKMPGEYTLVNGVPEEGSFLSLPKGGEKAILTLFTCVYTGNVKQRYVVQGHLNQQIPNE
ncbi:class A sortase [Enterococcus sp. AZ196]|uniref:class A sortase n=1 Tax=Enterococcus sp. AZ196 TaxID=2774659 RepID=UPI003D264D6B